MTKKTKTTPIKHVAIYSIAAISAFAAFTAGCENAELVDNVNWNATKPAAQPVQQPQPIDQSPNQPPPTTDPTNPGGMVTNGDQVSFGALQWVYGGFNGSKAVQSGASISGLRISNNVAAFKYDSDLSSWGLSHGDAGAIAAIFVQNSAGAWVGGKFDWISSSRTTRDLKHCLEGYNGWTLRGVPNPTQAAFVITDSSGRRRSNVLVATWQR